MNKKRIIPYIIAFAIPWLVVLVHSLIFGVWPFGEGNILSGDMELQYIPLYYELWDKVHSGESLYYSWTAMGGYDFYSNMIYYMVSPFTLFVLMVPRDWIIDVVQFIMVFKWALVPVTMLYYFLHTKYNTLKTHKTLVSFLLAMAFGISNGMIYFFLFPNWMEAMILFPLLLLGVENLVEDESWLKYSILLSITILCNYYIAFHICIFLVIWFFLRINKDTVNKVKKFVIFSGSSVLAAVLAGVTLLPGLFSGLNRFSEQANEEKNVFIRSLRIGLSDFFEGFFVLEPIEELISEKPNLYFSIVALVLAMLFVFIKIEKRKKIYLLSVVFVLTISFFWGLPNIVWHGFSIPNGVYNRFVNVYIFLLLFLALQVIIHFQDISKYHVIIIGVVGITVTIGTFLALEEFSGFYVYLLTVLLLVLYLILMLLYCRKSISFSSLLKIFIVVGLTELLVNATISLRVADSPSMSQSAEMTEEKALLEEIQLEKGQRVFMSSKALNLGMIADVPTAGGFLSCGDGNTNRLYERLGLTRSSEVVSAYMGGTPLLNLMFNTKYAVVKSQLCVSGANVVKEKADYTLYEIERLAGLGYMVDESILDWDVENEYPFALQNTFVEKAVGGESVLEIVYPDVKGNTSDEELTPNSELLEYGIYNYTYQTVFGGRNDAFQMEFTVDEDMDLYTSTYLPNGLGAYVFIDGEMVYIEERVVRQQTLHLGMLKKGQVVTMVFVPMTERGVGENISVHCQFAKFDERNFAVAYEKLSSNCFEVDTMESSYIKGDIHVDSAGVMMTSVQAVEGFDVLVNGEEIQYETIGNAFIGIPLEEGDYEIEFIYETPWAKKGIILSIIGMCLLVSIVMITKHKKRKNL